MYTYSKMDDWTRCILYEIDQMESETFHVESQNEAKKQLKVNA